MSDYPQRMSFVSKRGKGRSRFALSLNGLPTDWKLVTR
jgi:hypothetical protein